MQYSSGDETRASSTTEGLDALLERVAEAQRRYATYDQARVDRIFKAAALAANKARIALAKLAVAETGMGVVEDKVLKNHFASEYIYTKYKDMPTCGVLEEDEAGGYRRVAEPLGVIAGVVPTTNPTSTAIFKALIALKTRNAIVFSPHPRAKAATVAAARIVLEAAVAAGAPPDIIGWIEEPSVELTNRLMGHPKVALILATGGPGMVKAAYSSGKPALGVGAGNTPALIDELADLELAVSSIVLSKTFDNGVICASEQSVIVVNTVAQAAKEEFERRGAFFVEGEARDRLASVLVEDGRVSPAVVGQGAEAIAAMAGIAVPAGTKVLVAEASEVGPGEPFSWEKLSPILAFYRVADFQAGVALAASLVDFAGLGHTAALYTSPRAPERVEAYAAALRTGRVLVNIPASQGAIGDLFNFRLEPSLTLGCGSWGGNAVSENVGPKHLLNYKTIAWRRENLQWQRLPPRVYLRRGSLAPALAEYAGRKRAMVVTDRGLYALGFADRLTSILEAQGMAVGVIHEVDPDPTLAQARAGAERMASFGPDLIVALGGGSAMDAAKIMWVLYEHPEADFQDLSMRFMDIRKRVAPFPALGAKAKLVCVPTTSGTGSEVTPFAVITDGATGEKYPLADYELTPDMAIVDADLAMGQPPALTAASGYDALTHAVEALASVMATSYTDALALEAARMVSLNLVSAVRDGGDLGAREAMHEAATMAGMAFGNAFLGLCHSMAHKLGAAWRIPHGVANAILLDHVVRYNADPRPTRQAAFSRYGHPKAAEAYARLADALGLGGRGVEAKVERLVEALRRLRAEAGLPGSIRDCGVGEEAFRAGLDDLAERAFDDQCTGANPRYPLIPEIKELYLAAYYGREA